MASVDIASVQLLLARYVRCLDADALEEWPLLFTADGIYKVTSAENHARGLPMGLMYADSRGMLKDRVAALREANVYEGQRYRHILGPTIVDAENGGELSAETPFLVLRIMRDGETMMFASGRYLDRIVRGETAGELLFREKIVVCDSSRIDTLLALPL